MDWLEQKKLQKRLVYLNQQVEVCNRRRQELLDEVKLIDAQITEVTNEIERANPKPVIVTEPVVKVKKPKKENINV